MSQSQSQTESGRIDTDDHHASSDQDPVTTTGGAHYSCRLHDDPTRARSRGMTAGPVVQITDE